MFGQKESRAAHSDSSDDDIVKEDTLIVQQMLSQLAEVKDYQLLEKPNLSKRSREIIECSKVRSSGLKISEKIPEHDHSKCLNRACTINPQETNKSSEEGDNCIVCK